MRAGVALLLAAGVVATGANAASAPRLRIVDHDPLTLAGSGFGSHETVLLSVKVGLRTEHHLVRALGTGGFLSRFPGLLYNSCRGGLTVRAVGMRGHRTGLSIQPSPCPTS